MKRYLAGGVAGLVLLLAAFAVGRYTVPTKVVTKDKIVTVEKIVREQTMTIAETAKVDTKTNTKIRIVWKTKEVRLPNGAVEITTEGEQGAATTATTTTATTSKMEASDIYENFQESREEHEKTVTKDPPAWILGARAGIDTAKTPVFIVSAGRRVLGPFYFEGWAMKADHPAVGIGVAMAF